ncbi:MAG: hypothetical protein E6H79_16655 [Betaproteobacteria bacterium]|nr:MAG: hypothetical protein E6H79_16655 [Betaproteobacteria bacterium]
MNADLARRVADRFVQFIETGIAPDGLFTDDVFCDFTPPRWRLQAQGRDAVIALRRAGHPAPGSVPRFRLDPTAEGFVIEFEERWQRDGRDWYSREMARADLRGEAICALSVYCTGDWDAAREAEHRAAVSLARP